MALFFILIMFGLFGFYIAKTFIPLVFSVYRRHALESRMVAVPVQLSSLQHPDTLQNIGPYCRFPKSNLNVLAFFMELMALKQVSQGL